MGGHLSPLHTIASTIKTHLTSSASEFYGQDNKRMDVSGFALITGAASGIGRACAKTFARDGAAGLALLDVNKDSLAAVQAEIEEQQSQAGASPCRIITFALNVTNEDQVNQTVKETHQEFGRLDYVVNAAGIAMKHEGGTAFAETSDWKRILDVNLTGTCTYYSRDIRCPSVTRRG